MSTVGFQDDLSGIGRSGGELWRSRSVYIFFLGLYRTHECGSPSWMVTDRQSARLAFLKDFVKSAARFHPDASLVKGSDCFHSAWRPSVVRKGIDQWQRSSSRPILAEVVVAMRLRVPIDTACCEREGESGISASTFIHFSENHSLASIRCPDR